jgi:hypothetical protein
MGRYLSHPEENLPRQIQALIDAMTLDLTSDLGELAATKAELTAALLRETELLREKASLLQRQDMLAQEFEHRLSTACK